MLVHHKTNHIKNKKYNCRIKYLDDKNAGHPKIRKYKKHGRRNAGRSKILQK